MTSRGNPNYIKFRQQRIKALAKLLKDEPKEKHEQIMFKFSFDEGLTIKKIREYYRVLVATGMVKSK